MKTKRLIKDDGGFSLIELLVVMVIIGLLAGLVGPRLFRHVDAAKQKDAMAQIAMFEEALDLYRLENHKYPTSDEGLAALKDYLKRQIPKDPWGNPYAYKKPGPDNRDFEIVSYGADGQSGGEGNDMDIISWRGLN